MSSIRIKCIWFTCGIVLLGATAGCTKSEVLREERIEPVRQVSVSGSCQRQVTPDRGAITITAESVEADLKTASQRTTDQYGKLREGIQALKLADLELTTTEYSLYEVKEWQKDRHVSKGFRARMGLNVTTSDISRLGEVIELAAKEGVRDVGSLSTFLSFGRRQAEHSACLEDAVVNARQKADKMTAAAGAAVGDVLVMGEPSAMVSPPMPMRAYAKEMLAGAMADGAAPPTVEPGQQSLQYSVNVTYALK